MATADRLNSLMLGSRCKRGEMCAPITNQGERERTELTEEAILLAESYLAENVVGKSSRTDCYHIAIATVLKADILVSWNFKHIVNIQRIRGYNAVNLLRGYQTIEIRTPREIFDYENDN